MVALKIENIAKNDDNVKKECSRRKRYSLLLLLLLILSFGCYLINIDRIRDITGLGTGEGTKKRRKPINIKTNKFRKPMRDDMNDNVTFRIEHNKIVKLISQNEEPIQKHGDCDYDIDEKGSCVLDQRLLNPKMLEDEYKKTENDLTSNMKIDYDLESNVTTENDLESNKNVENDLTSNAKTETDLVFGKSMDKKILDDENRKESNFVPEQLLSSTALDEENIKNEYVLHSSSDRTALTDKNSNFDGSKGVHEQFKTTSLAKAEITKSEENSKSVANQYLAEESNCLAVEDKLNYIDLNFTLEKFIINSKAVKDDLEKRNIFRITSAPVSILSFLRETSRNKNKKKQSTFVKILDFGKNLYTYSLKDDEKASKEKIRKDFEVWKKEIKEKIKSGVNKIDPSTSNKRIVDEFIPPILDSIIEKYITKRKEKEVREDPAQVETDENKVENIEYCYNRSFTSK